MNNINVEEFLGTVEYEENKSSVFKYSKWNAQTAFNRLQISREAKKSLLSQINDNVNGLPLETRKMYDDVICLLEKIERKEIATIIYGE